MISLCSIELKTFFLLWSHESPDALTSTDSSRLEKAGEVQITSAADINHCPPLIYPWAISCHLALPWLLMEHMQCAWDTELV